TAIMMKIMLVVLASLAIAATPDRPCAAAESDWIRPQSADDPLVWGRRDGMVFGIPSRGGMGGPQGLIRVGMLNTSGVPTLVNFIAVEPVTKGRGPRHARMAFSELERSV